MTQHSQNGEGVEVIQSDRVQAALLYDRTSRQSWDSSKEPHTAAGQHMLNGKGDGSPYVQAFAAYRQSLTAREPATADVGRESAKDRAVTAMRAYVESAGVPITEFDPEFVVRMMVSFHKYGRVADAYPLKFDAASDVRARMKKYRETGNKHYLVDAANFAMIEAMHPSRASEWAGNDAADSPGRTTASGHRLVQETNAGDPIRGETILHVPGDEA